MDKILLFTALFGASAAFSRIVEQQTACKAGDMQACTAAEEYFTGWRARRGLTTKKRSRCINRL
ncbi:hypothetical protein [Campylobacter rectus]|uniref:hypothetical protein n=1 Tax=Campylobacter rectus TaxID=203 RepID=UPI000F5E9C79|nr:hypothetical protein [Campylobacter rectus]RRD54816.1 hypothetical protein EII16_03610 [Campylobacter rectus]